MIKNIKLKRILKSTIFRCLSIINKFISKNDKIIMLYSANKGISFNLAPLLNYLIKKGYNEKYKIICSIESMEYMGEKHKNVYYITHLWGVLLFLKTRHVFYTTGQIPIKPSINQIVIHMNHGTTDYKTLGALTQINNGDEFFFSYIITSAPIYIPIVSKEYLCPEECVKIAREPMVDRIIKPENKYDFSMFKKVLLWTPTFRQSDYIGYNDSNIEELTPLFKEIDYKNLNASLKRLNCILIVKLHPGQNLKRYKKFNYSNLFIYSHEDFEKSGYNLYDLMAQVDGMIGDYSSTSLQFLLTNKPLAYVIPDFDEYAQHRGFVFKNPKEYMPGWKIYTMRGFYEFLKEFCSGKDRFKDERIRIKNIIHCHQDEESCKRILKIGDISIS